MNWKLITKDAKNQPVSGVYSDWKELVAQECFYQCVYCAIHEAQFGGIDHYHIDHYRPKSIAEFKHLENNIGNLFYACPICNRFKSNDWPGEPDLNTPTYPDPSKNI
jgi:5-methylcytosine-specific restriction endonuclease McrA